MAAQKHMTRRIKLFADAQSRCSSARHCSSPATSTTTIARARAIGSSAQQKRTEVIAWEVRSLSSNFMTSAESSTTKIENWQSDCSVSLLSASYGLYLA